MKIVVREYQSGGLKSRKLCPSLETVTSLSERWHTEAGQIQHTLSDNIKSLKSALLELILIQDAHELKSLILKSNDPYLILGARNCLDNVTGMFASKLPENNQEIDIVEHVTTQHEVISASIAGISEALSTLDNYIDELRQVAADGKFESIHAASDKLSTSFNRIGEFTEISEENIDAKNIMIITREFHRSWEKLHHAVTLSLDELKDQAEHTQALSEDELKKLKILESVDALCTYDLFEKRDCIVRLPLHSLEHQTADRYTSFYLVLDTLERDVLKLVALAENRRGSEENQLDFEKAVNELVQRTNINNVTEILIDLAEKGIVERSFLQSLQMTLHFYFPKEEVLIEDPKPEEVIDNLPEEPAILEDLDTTASQIEVSVNEHSGAKNADTEEAKRKVTVEKNQGSSLNIKNCNIPNEDKEKIIEYWNRGVKEKQLGSDTNNLCRRIELCCQRLASIHRKATPQYQELLGKMLSAPFNQSELNALYKELGKSQHSERVSTKPKPVISDPYLEELTKKSKEAEKLLSRDKINPEAILALIENCVVNGRPARGALLIPEQFLIKKTKKFNTKDMKLALDYSIKYGLLLRPRQEVLSLAMPNDISHHSLRILYLLTNYTKFADPTHYNI